MKIFVLADMEGITGAVSDELQVKPGAPLYEEARDFLMSDLTAAMEGAREGGATEFVVFDMHFGGLNLRVGELHPAARVVMGKPKGSDGKGLDASFSGLFMIGTHSMAGTEGGILPHTYTDDIEEILLNEVRVGEIGIETALAGEVGVPLLLITGDSKTALEARKLSETVVAVCVKESISSTSGVCLPSTVTSRLIRQGAKVAVGRTKNAAPYRLKKPVELSIRYTTREKAEAAAAGCPRGAKIVDSRTLALRGESLRGIWEHVCPL